MADKSVGHFYRSITAKAARHPRTMIASRQMINQTIRFDIRILTRLFFLFCYPINTQRV